MLIYASPYGCHEVTIFMSNQAAALRYRCGQHSRWKQDDNRSPKTWCGEPITYALEVITLHDVKRLFMRLRIWASTFSWLRTTPSLAERRQLALAAFREGHSHHAIRLDTIEWNDAYTSAELQRNLGRSSTRPLSPRK